MTEPDARAKSPWSRWGAGALVAAVALAPFLQVAGHAFLHYDDDVYVTENPVVRDGLSWAGVRWAFTTVHAANWHPLTWLSHMLDVQLFGLTPGAHHLVNVALHAANAVLLWLVLSRLTGRAGRSALVAVLFAVHPLHVESVAWVAERKDVLSTLCGLAALGAYLHHVRRPGPGRLAIVALFHAASLMAKPMWVTAPFLLLLLDVWPLRRIEGLELGGAASEPGPPRLPAWRILAEKVPLLVLSAASSAITVVAQHRGGALETLAGVGLSTRLGNALVAYVRYLGMAVWPSGLAAFYPLQPAGPTSWKVLGAAAVIAVVTAWAVAVRKRAPWVLVGWCWYLGTLVPVIGVVQVGAQALADRYTYLPLVGILIAAVWEAHRLGRRLRVPEPALAAAAAVLVAVLVFATARQAAVWRDQEALFRHAIAVTGDNGYAELGLSQDLARAGRDREALAHAYRAVQLDPGWPKAHQHLGFVAYRLGLVDLAIFALQQAIALEPGYAEAHQNLAIVYGSKGLVVDAVREMTLAAELRSTVP